MSRWRRTPLRLRLALAFAVVMAVVLTATGAFIYFRLQAGLDNSIESGLRARTDDLAGIVQTAERGLGTTRAKTLSDQGDTFAQVLGRNRRVIDATPGLRARPLLGPAQLERATRGVTIIDRTRGALGEGPARLLASPIRSRDGTAILVVGAGLEQRDETLSNLLAVLALGGAAALALACLAGYGVALRALRPVEAMRAAAEAVSGTDPGGRLPVPATLDEIGRLGHTLNDMLARQDAALVRERQFVGDAGHELRTPLAILIAETDLARRRGRTPTELGAAVESIREEASRLDRIVGDLMQLARSDRHALPLDLTGVDMDQLLRDTATRFARLAETDGRAIEAGPATSVTVTADRHLLEQALGSLVENALSHGRGRIRLAAASVDEHVRVIVMDEGRGLPPGFANSAFDRFTQADPARSNRGSGLGLAIVAAIASAHGGRYGVEATLQPAVWFSIPLGSPYDRA